MGKRYHVAFAWYETSKLLQSSNMQDHPAAEIT